MEPTRWKIDMEHQYWRLGKGFVLGKMVNLRFQMLIFRGVEKDSLHSRS